LQIHDFHEARIQTAGLWQGRAWRDHKAWNDVPVVATRRRAFNNWRLHMQWQTPTATDLRFGFEITMYVAAR
jgi:pyrroloquinoline quinone biosynthesis protein A